MEGDNDLDEARRYAGRATVHLTVRVNKNGDPLWEALWRDSERRSKMRRIGPAWIKKRPPLANPYVDDSEGRTTENEPEVQESWREWWEPRGTTGRGREAMLNAGAYDVSGAMERARQLVVEHEVELRAKRRREQDEASRSSPQFRAAEAARLARERRTLAMAAVGWFSEASALKNWKPTVSRDYAALLAAPYDVPRLRARRTSAALLTALGETPLVQLDSRAIRDYLTGVARTRSSRTSNKHRTVIVMVLDWAAHEGYIDENPATKIKPARIRKDADLVVLSIEQVEAVARHADQDTADLVRLAAQCGLRLGELTGLRWTDVDWMARQIRVARSRSGGIDDVAPKSNRTRSVPLSDVAGRVLDARSKRIQGRRGESLIFGRRDGRPKDHSAVRRAYEKARERARADDPAMPKATFHHLRHTFGTSCAAAGLPLVKIQNWMGHADIQTTMIYIQWTPQTDDAERLSAALAIGAGEPTFDGKPGVPR